MGNLTPFLFRNDDVHYLRNKKIAKQVIEKIIEACSSHKDQSISMSFPKGGGCCNAIEALKTDHSSFDRTIVIHGNTWIDLASYLFKLEDAGEFADDPEGVHVKYLKECLEVARRHVSFITRYLKGFEGLNKKEKKNG